MGCPMVEGHGMAPCPSGFDARRPRLFLAMKASVRVPGKINLWLEVLGKRADGYHDLSTLMVPVALFDRLEMEMKAEGIRLECPHPLVPSDETNLVYRAAKAFFQKAGWRMGLRVRLEKGIPVGAGMGGGSADAAAVLAFLNRVAPRALSREVLHELARGLGADVPFFLVRRPALATGIGDRLEVVSGVPRYPLVLIKPPFEVSAAWAYGSLKLTRGGSRIKIGTLLACPRNPASCLENDLEGAVAARYPIVAAIKGWLLRNGAVGALMTGSGPTVFGIFETMDRAMTVARAARRQWTHCWCSATTTLDESGV